MKISITPLTQTPIYEQIKSQLREQILSGGLKAGTMLPSIRSLARELNIGVITSKRAYEDLCEEGLLVSYAGKGIFVAEIDMDYAKKINKSLVREQLENIKSYADNINVSKDEIFSMLEQIYEER